jgi:hypothetical protein
LPLLFYFILRTHCSTLICIYYTPITNILIGFVKTPADSTKEIYTKNKLGIYDVLCEDMFVV